MLFFVFQVFDSLNLTAYDLSVDVLDVHAVSSAYHFNLKYFEFTVTVLQYSNGF